MAQHVLQQHIYGHQEYINKEIRHAQQNQTCIQMQELARNYNPT